MHVQIHYPKHPLCAWGLKNKTYLRWSHYPVPPTSLLGDYFEVMAALARPTWRPSLYAVQSWSACPPLISSHLLRRTKKSPPCCPQTTLHLFTFPCFLSPCGDYSLWTPPSAVLSPRTSFVFQVFVHFDSILHSFLFLIFLPRPLPFLPAAPYNANKTCSEGKWIIEATAACHSLCAEVGQRGRGEGYGGNGLVGVSEGCVQDAEGSEREEKLIFVEVHMET